MCWLRLGCQLRKATAWAGRAGCARPQCTNAAAHGSQPERTQQVAGVGPGGRAALGDILDLQPELEGAWPVGDVGCVLQCAARVSSQRAALHRGLAPQVSVAVCSPRTLAAAQRLSCQLDPAAAPAHRPAQPAAGRLPAGPPGGALGTAHELRPAQLLPAVPAHSKPGGHLAAALRGQAAGRPGRPDSRTMEPFCLPGAAVGFLSVCRNALRSPAPTCGPLNRDLPP